MSTLAEPATSIGIIRWRYLWYVAAALAVMVWAIVSDSLWFLNYVHVFTAILWTGIDLFLGFVLGPVLRRISPDARRAISLQLMPRTLFILPTLSVIASTTGWFLGVALGFDQLPWPQYGWFLAALIVTTILGIQGTFYLLPVNFMVCTELVKEQPDFAWITRAMSRYYYVVASQGAMQVLIVVIMARFATGV